MREKVKCGWTSGVAETMNQQETFNTKGERREAKRRNRRRMKVTGTGVKRLQAIILRRAQRVSGSTESDG